MYFISIFHVVCGQLFGAILHVVKTEGKPNIAVKYLESGRWQPYNLNKIIFRAHCTLHKVYFSLEKRFIIKYKLDKGRYFSFQIDLSQSVRHTMRIY